MTIPVEPVKGDLTSMSMFTLPTYIDLKSENHSAWLWYAVII
jgi:hypothetical protein